LKNEKISPTRNQKFQRLPFKKLYTFLCGGKIIIYSIQNLKIIYRICGFLIFEVLSEIGEIGERERERERESRDLSKFHKFSFIT
jgi:hypothetical protein